MQIFGVSLASILYGFLFLVPGFLTYKLAIHQGKVTTRIDRFNKTFYTFLGSGIAISILILGYSLIIGSPLATSLAEYTMIDLSIGYFTILIISSINGIIIGVVIDRWVNQDWRRRKETAWDLTFDSAERPIKSTIVMHNGNEIRGFINVYDSSEHDEDILIKYPERIIRGEDGEEKQTLNLGEYSFICNDQISTIYFDCNIDI